MSDDDITPYSLIHPCRRRRVHAANPIRQLAFRIWQQMGARRVLCVCGWVDVARPPVLRNCNSAPEKSGQICSNLPLSARSRACQVARPRPNVKCGCCRHETATRCNLATQERADRGQWGGRGRPSRVPPGLSKTGGHLSYCMVKVLVGRQAAMIAMVCWCTVPK
jgi:hypothetical protein